MGFSRQEYWSGVPLIPSLSHSVVFPYFFALIAEEGFLISSCYSLELCFQMLTSFFFPLLFTSLLFTAIYKASSDSHFAFLHFFFLGMIPIPVSCATLYRAAHQAPPSLRFSRQEYWSGLPFPSPMHACMLSPFSRVPLCATLWTVAHQAPPSTGFSRQEYWSGLPFH